MTVVVNGIVKLEASSQERLELPDVSNAVWNFFGEPLTETTPCITYAPSFEPKNTHRPESCSKRTSCV